MMPDAMMDLRTLLEKTTDADFIPDMFKVTGWPVLFMTAPLLGWRM
jgi:hypothetical protein